jgi:hypothetical protein
VQLARTKALGHEAEEGCAQDCELFCGHLRFVSGQQIRKSGVFVEFLENASPAALVTILTCQPPRANPGDDAAPRRSGLDDLSRAASIIYTPALALDFEGPREHDSNVRSGQRRRR